MTDTSAAKFKTLFENKTLKVIAKKSRGNVNQDTEALKGAFVESFHQFKELLMSLSAEDRKEFLEGMSEALDKDMAEAIEEDSVEALDDLLTGMDSDNIQALMTFIINSGAIEFEEEEEE